MLALTRKLHEGILIGDNVRIEVAEIHDGRVRLAIDAPKAIRVLRDEIAEADREK